MATSYLGQIFHLFKFTKMEPGDRLVLLAAVAEKITYLA
jgi:hypothetical protein